MKHILNTFLLIVLFTACKPTSMVITSKKENLTKSEKRKNIRLIEQIVDTATENIGVKYKYGGTTKSGFDCSGLTYTIFNSYNIPLPHSSYEQSKVGVIVNRDPEHAKKGDLIFFKTNGKSQINHVGMVIEVTDDEIKFIHSSTSKGVIISSTKEPYYQRTFVQLNRIL
ncbi:cell wall-associated NlpC family hydrolase [Flavobacterium sp. CG_23.5]|uniref:C40 family peptidase n=1 Tax=Flavobacterium sp. CG_23.5 TaxID=2760708 RepID=UPI001EC13816|nr:C40 family peptidase [Flavobacterium sp. CG_23.5]MBP2283348.1 cell wall-associated NlpC family hydrolase [Flavobacterium sp. CG_23.5]